MEEMDDNKNDFKDDDEEEKGEDKKKELTPRGYQNEMVQTAIEENTILFLPTGAGKTFVSILLMKHYAENVEKPYLAGGQRIFFIAPKVALVQQQAEVIKDLTHFTVGCYIGSLGVDRWTASHWETQLVLHQVLVMSAQILLDCLAHSYITMDKICLIIMDECHHATEDHPMNLIMKNYYKSNNSERMPRILGLTATLIKRNIAIERVSLEVQTLENNLCSKMARVSTPEDLRGLYANPNIQTVSCKQTPHHGCTIAAMNIVDNLICCLDKVNARDVRTVSLPFQIEGYLIKNTGSVCKELSKMAQDLRYHIEALGIYGGNLAALAHLVALQRIVCSCKDDRVLQLLQMCICKLLCIRKLISDELNQYPEEVQIEKYSSQRVCRLVQIIRDNLQEMKVVKVEEENEVTTTTTGLCALVFVERRITAKVIYHILKWFKENDPSLNLLKPDFAVGVNKTSFDTREYILDSNRNKKSLEMFNNGDLNLLVASNVLEEGIDIPKCNIVIKFDSPVTFCSYIQSKGRARDKGATFYVLDVEDDASPKFSLNKPIFNQIEAKLQHIQLDSPIDSTVSEVNPDNIYRTRLNARATLDNAMKILYRYCGSLPQDKFSCIEPLFFAKDIMSTKKELEICGMQCTIVLPLNAKYRKPIKGQLKSNRKNARFSAALEAVKILHILGALNDHLKPAEQDLEDLRDSSNLFPHWKDEKGSNGPSPGSTQQKRTHEKHVPSFLMNCAPHSNDENVYMHLIVMTPVYDKPPDTDVRRQTFYNLLQDQTESIAILTSKPWPETCEFPIFMNVGKINVKIETNYKIIHLAADVLKKLRNCHLALLGQLLSLNKKFLIANFESGKSNYLVAPTILAEDGTAEINWALVHEERNFYTKGLRLTGKETDTELLLKVINPWYRGYNTTNVACENKNYIVTGVSRDMNPDSEFPSKNHFQLTYRDYYKSKYAVDILQDDQPLIDVKAISDKINCLNPRGHVPGNKRRRQDMDDFEEVLVPELCQAAVATDALSAQLWIKITSLPTILFRFSKLLMAEDLRQVIHKETGLGHFTLPKGVQWEPIKIDDLKIQQDITSKYVVIPKGYGPPKLKSFAPNITQMKSPWNETEPVDLDHNLTSISFLEIKEYEEFASIKLNSDHNSFGNQSSYKKMDQNIQVVPINLLSPKHPNFGPQQHKVYAALTTTNANDSLNMERLETLGDSYLKFTTSLYLYSKFEHSEGKLTEVKGKIVGNRNLYYCGESKDIPGILSHQAFYVNTDWKIPNLEVHEKLKNLIQDLKFCPSILHKIDLPIEEQLSGVIKNETWTKIQNIFFEENEGGEMDLNSNEIFLDVQTVPDKCVADCVEGLLGAYVESCGPTQSAKLLSWFGILPCEIENIMTSKPAASIKNDDPTVNVDSELNRHLAGTHKLENTLGYKFKDRGLLLQALSHASYIPNRLTSCFQRLEFLGDAVLDFLITSHIYEQCGNLSPGELTDLRSALVNNITFASLSVRYGFHTYMLHRSSTVISSVRNFVRYQEQNNHIISEEYLLLLQEDSAQVSTMIDVPKVLGDIFESLIGAIFLDSGKDLNKTWQIVYKLMKREIVMFSAKVPKQPVRMLYEALGDNLKFGTPYLLKSSPLIMLKLTLEYKGETCAFYGLGENKKLAKTAAAKCALKFIKQKS